MPEQGRADTEWETVDHIRNFTDLVKRMDADKRQRVLGAIDYILTVAPAYERMTADERRDLWRQLMQPSAQSPTPFQTI